MMLTSMVVALSAAACGSEVVCEDPSACFSGSGGSGGSGGSDCGLCFAPTACVAECGGAVVQESCCACPSGTFDVLECESTTTTGPKTWPPDLTDYCVDACACIGCTPEELAGCKSAATDIVDTSIDLECVSELTLVDECLDSFQCIAGSPELPADCQAKLDDLQLCVSVPNPPPPPPLNVCEIAAEICNNALFMEPCGGAVECMADCVVQFGHCNYDGTGPLASCLNTCVN